MIKEVLVEHLKYIDDHYEFSAKASENDKSFMIDNGYVSVYDDHVIVSDEGHDLLDTSYKKSFADMELDDMLDFNTDDEEFKW